MKVKVESFKIVCDCCGDTFHNGNDFVCFVDDFDGSMIRIEAESSGWISIDDKHYCPDCFTIDDENRIVTKNGHKFDYDTREEIKKE